MRERHHIRPALGTALILFFVIGTVRAGERFITVDGTGPSCTAGDPCSITTFNAQVANFLDSDEVYNFGPGTFSLGGNSEIIDIPSPVNSATIIGAGRGNTVIEGVKFERDSNGNLTVSDLSLTNSDQVTPGGCLFIGSGTSNILIENVLFQRCNSTERGGGVFLDTSGPITIRNSEFLDNTGRGGGGVWATEAVAELTVLDSVFQRNRAFELNGGGLRSAGDDTAITDCVFEDNHTILRGGGFATRVGNVVASNTVVKDCTAETGGGISVEGGLARLEDVQVTGCVASCCGGGINSENNLVARLTDVVVTECSSTEFGGGGVRNLGSTMFFTNVNVTKCSAGGKGGGIKLSGESTSSVDDMDQVFLSENSADLGGGLFLDVWKSLSLSGPVYIVDNSATTDGGGLYADDSASGVERIYLALEEIGVSFVGGLWVRGNGATAGVDNVFCAEGAAEQCLECDSCTAGFCRLPGVEEEEGSVDTCECTKDATVTSFDCVCEGTYTVEMDEFEVAATCRPNVALAALLYSALGLVGVVFFFAVTQRYCFNPGRSLTVEEAMRNHKLAPSSDAGKSLKSTDTLYSTPSLATGSTLVSKRASGATHATAVTLQEPFSETSGKSKKGRSRSRSRSASKQGKRKRSKSPQPQGIPIRELMPSTGSSLQSIGSSQAPYLPSFGGSTINSSQR